MNTPWWLAPVKSWDEPAQAAAQRRRAQLTKPPGALGVLEEVAVRLAAMRGTECPRLDRVWISVFAADHGVAEEGVSAFPQAVTAEMVKNFARGGAAINVAARSVEANLEVVNLGTVQDITELAGVRHEVIASSTANFTQAPAMTVEQCVQALLAGRRSVERALADGAQLFIGGEMGIGNTTAATALVCALLHEAPERLAGPGTGLDANGVAHKAAVIRRALATHGFSGASGQHPRPGNKKAGDESALLALQCLGGFEIAALAGAYLACAKAGLTVLVDGFISSAAALVAESLCPGTARWFLYAHVSAEPGHARLLTALQARPLLSLGMRLGEGSGAAVAVPLLRLACALHNGMATFAEAGVSQGHAG